MSNTFHQLVRPSIVAAAIAAGVLVAGLAGCADNPGPKRISHRVIDPDPAAIFDPASMGTEKTLAHWRLGDPGELDRWRFAGLDVKPRPNAAVRLVLTGEQPSLERRIDAGSDPIHLIRVAANGLWKGELTLDWADKGQAFSESRSITVQDSRTETGPRGIFAFDLSQHSRWTGTAERIRLRPKPTKSNAVRVNWIETIRRVAEPRAREAMFSTAWKIDLDNEVRSGLLGNPARPIKESVQIGTGGANLRFAYGLQKEVGQATTFEITATDETGSEKVIFTDTLDPPSDGKSRWHEEETSLDLYAGASITLRFSVRTTGEFDIFRGLPVWGSPELLEPVDELTRPNVLVICLDTLRADRLSSYGHSRPTTPEIDAWAASSSILFRKTVAPAPWTLPSHASYLSGTEAIAHGTNHFRAAPPELEMMAETLRSAGYTTAAITGGGMLHPQHGFTQGFDSYLYWPHKSTRKELAWGRDRLEEWVGEHRSEPFFLFFHTYEIHYPFYRRQPYYDRLTNEIDPPLPRKNVQMQKHGWKGLRYPGDYLQVADPGSKNWRTPLTDREKVMVGAMYDSGVAYADSVVGEILDLVRNLDPTRPALVVLTSDHGEALGEDDRAGHSFLEDYNILVPLIIELPGGRGAGTVIDDQVRLIDMLPTVLDALGLDHDHVPHGRSLLPLIDGGSKHPDEAWIYSSSNNRGLALRIGNRLKYTFNNTAFSEISGEERLVDLEADPAEALDLAPTHERTAELRERARREIEEHHNGYRLTVRNGGGRALTGTLSGSWAGVSRIKTAQRSCLKLETDRADAVFTAPPGCRATLAFEGLLDPEVKITARMDGESRHPDLEEAIDLDELTAPVELALDDSGWRRSTEPEHTSPSGFTIWWNGRRPTLGDTQTADETALIDQLRALGYIE